jgi:diadenosine tetraphosphate (Ap4A) HIT family hydrolase
MRSNEHCQFCVEFKNITESVYWEIAEGNPPDRAIYRTKSFRVIPPLGQVVEGAVLLVSERHVPSCAQLSAQELNELELLISRTELILSHVYTTPIFFEHGPLLNSGKGTCCVDHAHIHAFPVMVDVHTYLCKRFSWAEISNLQDLTFRVNAMNDMRGYLFVQQQGHRYFYECDVIPSQLIRQIIASELGVPERWHWRSYLGISEMCSTLKRLRSIEWSGS